MITTKKGNKMNNNLNMVFGENNEKQDRRASPLSHNKLCNMEIRRAYGG